jgi:hypothetical protein
MSSRAARILVPLAVEVAFALVVGVIIVATDGGRYGLGAKAALERLAARYQTCDTYVGRLREQAGKYTVHDPRVIPFQWEMRTYVVAFKRPGKMAGYVQYYDGSRSLYVKHDKRAEVLVDGIAAPLALKAAPWVQPPPWCVGRVHGLLESRNMLAALAPMCDYVELERRKGPDGKHYAVLVAHCKLTETEVWIDPGDDRVRAVVRPGADDCASSATIAELYGGCVFDTPLDDALFNLDDDAFGKLKQWMAERESAPTN